jgi:hypothetical protein
MESNSLNDKFEVESVNPATLRLNVSPLTGLEKTIPRTQGGALRLSPRRSAAGLVCLSLSGRRTQRDLRYVMWSHGDDGFNSNERQALQAPKNDRLTETKPDVPGSENVWPFGPEDTVPISHVDGHWQIPTDYEKMVSDVMIVRGNDDRPIGRGN